MKFQFITDISSIHQLSHYFKKDYKEIADNSEFITYDNFDKIETDYMLVLEDDKHYQALIALFLEESEEFDKVLLVNNVKTFHELKSKLNRKPKVVSIDFLYGSPENMYEETSTMYKVIKDRFPETPVFAYTNFESAKDSEKAKFTSDTQKLLTLFNTSGDSVYDKKNIKEASGFRNIIRNLIRISDLKEENKSLKKEKNSLIRQKGQLEKALDSYIRENRENPTFKHLEKKLIGQTPEMKKVKFFIELAAKNDQPICIIADNGTGKENVARAIHRLHKTRFSYPFEVVDCASIPKNLLESELFGHIKGAFTDAHQNKKGKIELADKGTLFLDEIGDLALEHQAKLLRVLQNKEVTQVGSNKSRVIDFRLICATNKDLEQMIKSGEFREDLSMRIRGFPFPYIPPLRDRSEDIPFLIEHFIQISGKSLKFDDNALNYLSRYPWPGNIREIEHLIKYIADVHEKGTLIREEDVRYCMQLSNKKDSSIENKLFEDAKYFLEEVVRIVRSFKGKKNFTQKFLASQFVSKTGKKGISVVVFQEDYYYPTRNLIPDFIINNMDEYEIILDTCPFIRRLYQEK